MLFSISGFSQSAGSFSPCMDNNGTPNNPSDDFPVDGCYRLSTFNGRYIEVKKGKSDCLWTGPFAGAMIIEWIDPDTDQIVYLDYWIDVCKNFKDDIIKNEDGTITIIDYEFSDTLTINDTLFTINDSLLIYPPLSEADQNITENRIINRNANSLTVQGSGPFTVEGLTNNNLLDSVVVVDGNGNFKYRLFNSTMTSSVTDNNAAIDVNVIATHTSADGTVTTVKETVTSVTDNLDGTFTYSDEDGINTVISSGFTSSFSNTQLGNLIARHNNGNGVLTDINETITTLIDNGDSTFTYTSENGTTININNYVPLSVADQDVNEERNILMDVHRLNIQGSTDDIRFVNGLGYFEKSLYVGRDPGVSPSIYMSSFVNEDYVVDQLGTKYQVAGDFTVRDFAGDPPNIIYGLHIDVDDYFGRSNETVGSQVGIIMGGGLDAGGANLIVPSVNHFNIKTDRDGTGSITNCKVFRSFDQGTTVPILNYYFLSQETDAVNFLGKTRIDATSIVPVKSTHALELKDTADPLKLEGLQTDATSDTLLTLNGNVVKRRLFSDLETITTLVDNLDGTVSYINENNDTTTIVTGQTLTSITDDNADTFTYTDESGNQTIVNKSSPFRNVALTNRIDDVTTTIQRTGRVVIGDGSGAYPVEIVASTGSTGLRLRDGDNNSIITSNSTSFTSTAAFNVAIGTSCFSGGNIGGSNVALGSTAGFGATTGNGCVFVGTSSGRDGLFNAENIMFGKNAGRNANWNIGNVAIGLDAGRLDTLGSNNILIGSLTNVDNSAIATPNSSVAIGYQAEISASNQIVLGGTSTTSVVIEGVPSYANTGAAVAAGLRSGSVFKVSNGDGSSALHIID